MTKFKITYRDPESEATKEVVMEFNASGAISARDWARDWAYSAADKGWYEIEELHMTENTNAL